MPATRSRVRAPCIEAEDNNAHVTIFVGHKVTCVETAMVHIDCWSEVVHMQCAGVVVVCSSEQNLLCVCSCVLNTAQAAGVAA